MGPWWKYCFFRQESVLAHDSIWTNFRGHINFEQAIKHLKRVERFVRPARSRTLLRFAQGSIWAELSTGAKLL